ncbi:MAG: hypothetical protein ACYCVN_06295 [Acidimicrobiales bacterium]
MELKPGQRLRSAASDVELVVIRATPGDTDLTCGGVAVIDPSAGSGPGERSGGASTRDAGTGDDRSVLLGKRYVDGTDTVELLCTKAGTGPLAIDGRPLEVKSAKPLPSSD